MKILILTLNYKMKEAADSMDEIWLLCQAETSSLGVTFQLVLVTK